GGGGGGGGALGVAVPAVLGGGPGAAWGLQIDAEFRVPLSQSPAIDADGQRLGELVRAAADFYEARIGDDHELRVQYYYFDFGSTSNIGATTLRSESDGRITEVFLRVAKAPLGSSGNWFYDDTPDDHSEFDLDVTRVGDLSGAQRNDGFVGDVPDTLEVGHAGGAIGGGATGKFDLYTVVLHEMGHALGLLSTASSAQGETADGDYDFRGDQLGGRAGAVRHVSGEISHLRPDVALMTNGIDTGQRRMPSATDLLAIASVSGFTHLDLDRKTFARGSGTHDWTGSNWIGGRSPDGGDDAFIGSRDADPTVRLVGDVWVRNLDVRHGDALDLNGRRLTLGNDLDLFDGGTTLDVRGGGAVLSVDDLRNKPGTTTRLRDGGRIEADDWDVDAGATVRLGSGTARVYTRWTNDGVVRNDSGGVATFEAGSSATTWDLDGDQDEGRIEVNAGDVRFVGGRWAGDLRGTIVVSAGRTFTGAGDLTLAGGRVELNGDASRVARLDGGSLIVNGGTLRVAGQSELDDDLRVNGGTLEVGGDAFLGVRDDVVWAGGTVSGGGLNLTAGNELELGDGAAITLASLAVPDVELGGTGTASASVAWTGSGTAAGTTLWLDIVDTERHDTLTHGGGSGAAWAGTTLALRTAATPEVGDRVTLIDGLSDAAVFAGLQGVSLAPDLRWAVVQDGAILEAVAARPGDLDLDGDVDFGDAMGFVAAFRALHEAAADALLSPLTWAQGDFDADRDVDLDDALALADAFSGSSGGAASVVWLAPALGLAEGSPEASYLASGGVVPEPGAGAWTVVGLALTLRRRVRRAY
ncbi:MAG: hypothetical protein AAGE65_03440, partial [Planctomycetota bacterium]